MKTRQQIDWPRLAAEFGAQLPRGRLHPAVLDWCASAGSSRWTVALSGGADSLALLLLLWIHWPERRPKLLALHFNHRLRGRAADRDEAFCRQVCAALRVKFVSGRWTRAQGDASEGQARVARFAFFEKQLRAVRGRILWLGHQQDDIAESMLMRLARGSGSSGLAAPRPVHVIGKNRVHVRPLLSLKKVEIIVALRAVGLTWREDATNAEAAFFRNRVRHQVIPAWQRAAGGRDVLAGAALARERLEEDDAALEAWLNDLQPLQGRILNLRCLNGKPPALVRRALHRWLLAQPEAGELSRQGFALLLEAAIRAKSTRQSLGKVGFAVISKGCLTFLRTKKRARSVEPNR